MPAAQVPRLEASPTSDPSTDNPIGAATVYHHSTRPSPVVCALAGSLCTIGVVGIIARALDAFSRFTLHPSLDVPSFAVAVFGTGGGGTWIAWLIIQGVRARNAALRAENVELRAERDKFGELLQAVKDADAQGEVNGERLKKVMAMLEDQRASETTQQLAPVRSIKGGA